MTQHEFRTHVTTTRDDSKRTAIKAMRVAALRAHGVTLDSRGRTRRAGKFTADPILAR